MEGGLDSMKKRTARKRSACFFTLFVGAGLRASAKALIGIFLVGLLFFNANLPGMCACMEEMR